MVTNEVLDRIRVIAPSHPAKTYPEEKTSATTGDNKTASPQDDAATTVSKYLSALSQREWDSLPLPSLTAVPTGAANKSQTAPKNTVSTRKSTAIDGSSQSNAITGVTSSVLQQSPLPVDKDI